MPKYGGRRYGYGRSGRRVRAVWIVLSTERTAIAGQLQ
jgi:hypothetical protein